jgi:hypothetical protein
VPLIGEVRTGLLQNRQSVPADVAGRILRLRADEPVRLSERPVAHAVSPDRPFGVDCRVATASGRKLRGIGTTLTHVSLTAGRVLQASSHAQLTHADSDRRLGWSHYLSRAGRIELTSTKVDWDDVRRGFLGQEPADALDLGAINEHTMDDVQERPELDRSSPMRTRRVALRWFVPDPVAPDRAAAGPDAGPAPDLAASFTIVTPTVRSLHLRVPPMELSEILVFCEDLALHDWLLTTLLDLVDRSQRAADRAAQVERVRPAVEHLIHVWLPGARVGEMLMPLWESFDRNPGFSRQWDATVNRIRDLVAVTTVSLLRPGVVVPEPATAPREEPASIRLP